MSPRLIIAILLLASGTFLRAQSPPPQKFEVASIKPCKDASTGQLHTSPNAITITCSSVDNLIREAYIQFAHGPLWRRIPGAAMPVMSVSQGEMSMPIKGSTGWIQAERFTIDAKALSPVAPDIMLGPMMQELLRDRFKLRIHREPSEIAIYELTVSKGGAKFRPAKAGNCKQQDPAGPPPPRDKGQPAPLPLCGGFGRAPNNAGTDILGVTMQYFSMLLSMSEDRDVVDKTGLNGEFDLHLDVPMGEIGFGRRGAGPAAHPSTEVTATAPDPGGTLNDAIRKLGLVLQPAKKHIDAIVIDHVERPTPN